ncbi:hypothetical protein PVAP13_2NG556600 [Panicum virgatum]|uniref:Uncharacterized protein n=1 Tax=Panicum virgatum TaxID=38727 RepID=A0A8T0VP57_PANVG|nr:hypothetical protein PVAP13_2NG556600 [Panicum virgatum]
MQCRGEIKRTHSSSTNKPFQPAANPVRPFTNSDIRRATMSCYARRPAPPSVARGNAGKAAPLLGCNKVPDRVERRISDVLLCLCRSRELEEPGMHGRRRGLPTANLARSVSNILQNNPNSYRDY